MCASLLSVGSSAQITPEMQRMYSTRDDQPITTYETAPNTAVIICHVFAEEKPARLDRSARFDLTNLGNHFGVFLIVPGHEDAVFTNTILGTYDVTVTAVGYLSAHQTISVLNAVTQHVDVVLQRDPSAVILNEASGLMPGRAKKEAHRAVSSLKSGELDDAQRHLEAAYQLAPSNADLNFLLGYLHFVQRDYAKAGTYLGAAANLNPHSAQILTLLGRTNLVREDYPAARSALEQAVLADAEDWLPHDLLADVYLKQKEYGKARNEGQVAVAKGAKYGKDASGPAELVLGQALIALGQKEEGIQALETFLKDSPQNPMVYQVRALITRIKQSDPASAAGGSSAATEINASRADPLGAVPDPELSMETWRPPDIDDAKPTLDVGVTCPAAHVLAEAGKRVQELVLDVTRFTADENLFHQSLDAAGLSTGAETRKYNYVAAISSEPGKIFIEEYRSDKGLKADDPDAISSTGFVMLALVFHPEMQGDFDFDCEGRGEWRGQPTWLVHFRQRPDRPNHMHGYMVGGQLFRVDLKGRAWISADTFQIVRMEADMVSPMHEIELLSEHQTVEYGAVPFAKKNTTLWLPKDAEIYIDLRKHHYYRRDSFDHYMLFDVDAEQKDKLPAATDR
ncbi:MAG TPA: tetratricopeptide repeat protein [Verrucomicrobiae bacterium]|nr:tetratricopeptide repeat protein [Verrucomicrobiae bacterium]